MYLKYLILIIGWPMLILMSIGIMQKAYSFYTKLHKTIIGKLILPTAFGWLFGMYSLGAVATAYMFDITWYWSVIPAFVLFFIAIIILYITIEKWESEAIELESFYTNLESLVKQRTAELEESHGNEIKHEKEIQALKDQFVFIAAHELRTPVTAMKWGLELVLEEGEKRIGKETFEQLLTVKDSNERLIGLVEDLLNVARIESKTIQLNIEKCDLSDIVKKLVKEQQQSARSKNVIVKLSSDEKLEVESDPVRVKQVITNLVSNAIKYNKEGGEVFVDVHENGKKVKVVVRDTGIGIDEKDLSVLFTKFGRIRNKDTEGIEGTGLGLFVTKELVMQLGGTIEVTSKVGEGTTMTVKLPKQSEQV